MFFKERFIFVMLMFVITLTAYSQEIEEAQVDLTSVEKETQKWEGIWSGTKYDPQGKEEYVSLAITPKDSSWDIVCDIIPEKKKDWEWSVSEDKILGKMVSPEAGDAEKPDDSRKMWIVRWIFLERYDGHLLGWYGESEMSSPPSEMLFDSGNMAFDKMFDLEFDKMP